jgi:gamma-glutamylcysteine synthetase
MLSAELIGVFILVLVAISIGYLIGKKRTEARVEIETWKVEWEKSIRADAVKKSRAAGSISTRFHMCSKRCKVFGLAHRYCDIQRPL